MFRLKSSEFRVYLTNTSALSSYLVLANLVRPNFWLCLPNCFREP
jgi:hypothetical protein